jgi:hypothetical protein
VKKYGTKDKILGELHAKRFDDLVNYIIPDEVKLYSLKKFEEGIC